MQKNLVIVESPTKAKTISKFLGPDFNIQSSFGHLRDLPEGKIGVDTKKDFEPTYVIAEKNEKHVEKLVSAAKGAGLIYFATDEDREGEAISWHLIQILKTPKNKIKRIAFHEITKPAILEALENPREIDMNLVNAQQARRILDRLVGYELSPFLWRKVAKGLSAGRVQSVAVRLIVEREREVEKFKKEEYWTIQALLSDSAPTPFQADLIEIDSKKIEQIKKHKLFTGEYSTKKTIIQNEKQAKKILNQLKKAEFKVDSIDKKQTKRNPLPPFTTARLQQEAARRLGFSSKQIMMIAQQLYEGIKIGSENVGLITYMRTDSVNLSDKFLNDARNYVKQELGEKYLPQKSNFYKTKSKVAQEAHEAIRPTEANNTPETIKQYLDPKQAKLYDLIWRRALASQMSPAVVDSTGINIVASSTQAVKPSSYLFRATGSTIKFDGYLKIYRNTGEDKILPQVKEGEKLKPEELKPERHETTPPPRYSEASLIKALEENEIGRPSTYASIMSTIQARNYVEKNEDKRFIPTDIGSLVNDVLAKHFPKIVDIKFTAQMEDDLDEIANGKKEWIPILNEFYNPFHENLNIKYKEVKKQDIINEETDETCEKCKKPMVIKTGRYGKFLACTGFPDCKNTKQIDKQGKIVKEQAPEKTDEKCEKCGQPMIIKMGKFGKFLACSGYPDCKNTKPLEGDLNVKCPTCGGNVVQRRSKRGKIFYGCSNYPKCNFVLWSKPDGKKCPKCKSLMVAGPKDKAVCSNKECKGKK